MLYIVFRGKTLQTWHVNIPRPIFLPNKLDELQADGDELNHIRRMFPELTARGRELLIGMETLPVPSI